VRNRHTHRHKRKAGLGREWACRIKAIYRAENADMALLRLEEFEAAWGKRYPAIGQMWRRAWERVVPFFAFARSICKMTFSRDKIEVLFRHAMPGEIIKVSCKGIIRWVNTFVASIDVGIIL
jgi:transposase-like protein